MVTGAWHDGHQRSFLAGGQLGRKAGWTPDTKKSDPLKRFGQGEWIVRIQYGALGEAVVRSIMQIREAGNRHGTKLWHVLT